VLIDVRRGLGGDPAALFVLNVEQRNGLRTLVFADACVSDNNAPVEGPAFPVDATGFAALWAAVRKVAPKAAMLRLEKLPALRPDGTPNPALGLPGLRVSAMSQHPQDLPPTWEAYRSARTKHFRKEQERVWRVFQRHEGAAFIVPETMAGAQAALSALESMQAARMQDLGASYCLDEEAHRDFYRAVLRRGHARREAYVTTLQAEGQIVAALFVMESRGRAAFVRLAHLHGQWRNASPGRLLLERTLMDLQARGVHTVDFSIGDYAYKMAFGVGTEPLYEVVRPLSIAGWPVHAGGLIKRRLRDVTWVRTLYRRLRGLPPA
jgi:CelD/BcsL family acetyltransferase involved in cellulose biosynthesis